MKNSYNIIMVLGLAGHRIHLFMLPTPFQLKIFLDMGLFFYFL